jgi:ABC-type dipeptide/oligopeptide/nickel transport system permease component
VLAAMLRYALRRVLWSIPTLIATSLVIFFVTTLAPEPAPQPETGTASGPGDPGWVEARRARFLQLPRLINTSPQDVRSRAREALSHIAAGDDRHAASASDLCRLGGAALPDVLPLLETLPPDARGRVAAALTPVAIRMGLRSVDEANDAEKPADADGPESAVLFWTQFWENRELDFSRAAVDRAVRRLVEHGSELRERELVVLDTFALPAILRAMATSHDGAVLERLTRLAQHMSGRGEVLRFDASASEARRAVADWQEWWFVHATDYVALEGTSRAIAFLTETRYGKWLERARSGELGVSVVDGEPIGSKIRAHASLTLLVCMLAMLAGWALAVPIGAIGAWRQGRTFDVASSAVLLVLYAAPTFAVAELLRRIAAAQAIDGARVALAVTSLTVGSLATLSRWQRAAMLEVIRQDYVRTARAKGLSAVRVAVVHAMRNALLPMITLAGLHLPTLLAGALVVEEVFRLPGLGFETLRAIESHDTPWLMAVVLVAAVAVTLGLVASDVACGTLDPRVREVLAGQQGKRPL